MAEMSSGHFFYVRFCDTKKVPREKRNKGANEESGSGYDSNNRTLGFVTRRILIFLYWRFYVSRKQKKKK